MTDHFRPGEFVDALDDALDASRRAHLAGCERCRTELASLRSVANDATQVDAPAPSPLFWDHFSERVKQATSVELLPSRSAWWAGWWRPASVFAASVAAIALVFVLGPGSPVAPMTPAADGGDATAAAAAPDDGSWSLVVGLASELEWADVKAVAEPVAGTADEMIEELTSAERAALVRLLQKEMGEQ